MEPQMNRPNDPVNSPLFKILLLGDPGAGKTSIIKRYVHNYFSQEYRSTIGVDFSLKIINWDENTKVRLQLWDIAGEDRYSNITRIFFRDAVGAFVVFDMTRLKTLESAMNWKSDLDNKVQLPDGSYIPCILLGNKCDKVTDAEFKSRGLDLDAFCEQNGFFAWFRTSAKDNINVEEAAETLLTKVFENEKRVARFRNGKRHISLNKNDNTNSGCYC